MSGETSAWVVDQPGPIDEHPLLEVDRPVSEPGPAEVLVQIRACGVCRTDLHLAEGDLAPKRRHVTPGHEVVGVVEALGEECARFAVGDRVGIAWLASTCGQCDYCLAGDENLCVAPTFTGWDRDGGYCKYAVCKEAYAYELPALSDEKVAPLLCSGIIGYRALKRSRLPTGGRLGIYGFGASAHLAAQVAMASRASVHVFTRSERARELALDLGAASARPASEAPPEYLDAAILFAPNGDLVPIALSALRPGGTLAIAGIHLSDIPALEYERHLFRERTVTSVTANTRLDGAEFLALAGEIDLEVTTTPYPMSEANRALSDLAHGAVNGAAVLVNEG